MRNGGGFAGETLGGLAQEGEVVLVALDDFALAVHEVDVVTEEEVEVLLFAAGELEFDGVELEEEVVAEGADEGEAVVLGVAELLDEGAEDGEGGGLFGALFFGEEGGEGFEGAGEAAGDGLEGLPVGVGAEDGLEEADEEFAAGVQGAEVDAAAAADDFEGGIQGSDVPAGVAFGVLVAGGEIDPAVVVEVAEEVAKAAAVGEAGTRPGDVNPRAGDIAKQAHERWKPSG